MDKRGEDRSVWRTLRESRSDSPAEVDRAYREMGLSFVVDAVVWVRRALDRLRGRR